MGENRARRQLTFHGTKQVTRKRRLTAPKPFDFEKLRRLVVIAMFSDDVLMSTLVLKGGNALTIGHRLESRTSIDIDLSMPNDFDDIGDAERRLLHALTYCSQLNGLAVFDFRLRKETGERSARLGTPAGVDTLWSLS